MITINSLDCIHKYEPMKTHTHVRMHVILFYMFVVLGGVYACTQAPAFRIETSILNEDVQPAPTATSRLSSLLDGIMKIQHAIMRACNTKTTDLVFVSDPYFAANYVGDSLKGYGLFYQLSLLYSAYARLYMGFEIESQLQSNFDIATAVLKYKTENLSVHDMFLIRYAERVVVSPLLHVFAPTLYEDIVRIRASEGREVQTITFDLSMHDSRYITVDYSNAMHALGVLAAEQATRRAPDAPRIVMFLDSTQTRVVSERIRYFSKGVLQSNPAIELQYIWNSNFGTDTSLESLFQNISDDALVLFDIGSQAYSMLFMHISRQNASTVTTQERVMIVDYLHPEHIEYMLPVLATVFVPNDFVFQKNFHINAILSRYSIKNEK